MLLGCQGDSCEGIGSGCALRIRVRESNYVETVALTSFARCDSSSSILGGHLRLTNVFAEGVRVRESNDGRTLPSSLRSEDCTLGLVEPSVEYRFRCACWINSAHLARILRQNSRFGFVDTGEGLSGSKSLSSVVR